MRAIEIIGRLRERYSNKYTKTPNHNKDHYINWLQDEYSELAMKQANDADTGNDKCHIQNVVCSTCKHWGGQGTIGTVTHTEGNYRPCMAYLFGDMDNENFKPMPDWKVTFGSLNGAKGVLEVHKDFGCVNHNPDFD